ncbi:MAG: phosphohydrolase [Raoultibacter sp.]
MSKFSLLEHSDDDIAEYLDCVQDLLDHPSVQSMDNYYQHGGTSILDHSMYVSYLSYKVCKQQGCDYRSAARGGLLHDFFLYQRHVDKPYKGWHTTGHPRLALKNALELFSINEIEQDIIKKHMWPVCLGVPRFQESLMVSMVDKYCCAMEFTGLMANSRTYTVRQQFAGATI